MLPQAQDAGDAGKERNKQGEVNPTLVQTTVQSKFFWGYMGMLNVVHSLIEGFTKWCEGCPCHDVLAELNPTEKQILKHCAVDDHCGECVLKGLRASELAAGTWRDVFEQIMVIRLRCRASHPHALKRLGGLGSGGRGKGRGRGRPTTPRIWSTMATHVGLDAFGCPRCCFAIVQDKLSQCDPT